MQEIKETIPFNFDEIYDGISELFVEKGYDSPYEGSNLAQLITSMAYSISTLNANTALNINETILTLAQKRDNIIQNARLLGYEATQKISYVYELKLKCTETKKYNISRFSKFTASGNTYYYMGEELIFDATSGDTCSIFVKEGTLITYEDEPENLKQVIANNQFLDIPYNDVEADGIEVYVTYYQANGVLSIRERFFNSPTLLIDINDNLNKKFIRLENIDINTPRIHFTLSNVGNKVPIGAVVEINVLQSKGQNGEINKSTDVLSELEDIEVLSYRLSIKGNDVETNQSIKDNAPILHNTASRCVTANDYEVIAKKHSACKEAYVFGGEDEHPVKLGNIFLTLTPKNSLREFDIDDNKTKWVLKDLSIENNYLLPEELFLPKDKDGNPGVIDNIKNLNLPALRYNIRNPLYILMNFDIKIVKYALSSVRTEVRQQIFDVVNNYIQMLETPKSEYFTSNIIKKIDLYLTDVSGVELDVSFKIMLDSNSISEETTQVIKMNEIKDESENAIHLYLDVPYENLYDKTGIITENLPKIDTEKFILDKDLIVDFENPEESNQSIFYKVYLGEINENNIIGKYTIYNDKILYIKVKLFSDKFNELVNNKILLNKLKELSNNENLLDNLNNLVNNYDNKLLIEYNKLINEILSKLKGLLKNNENLLDNINSLVIEYNKYNINLISKLKKLNNINLTNNINKLVIEYNNVNLLFELKNLVDKYNIQADNELLNNINNIS